MAAVVRLNVNVVASAPQGEQVALDALRRGHHGAAARPPGEDDAADDDFRYNVGGQELSRLNSWATTVVQPLIQAEVLAADENGARTHA